MSMRIARERSVWAEVKITTYSFFVLTLKLSWFIIHYSLLVYLSLFFQSPLLCLSIFAFHHPCLLPRWIFFSFKNSGMRISCMKWLLQLLWSALQTHTKSSDVCTPCCYGFNNFPGASIRQTTCMYHGLHQLSLPWPCRLLLFLENVCLCVYFL